MFINRRGPYGSVYAQEALEIALIGAAFDQEVSMAFVDDGVFLLRQGQDAGLLEMKTFTAAYRALADFEIRRLYVEHESLQARGMHASDLVMVADGGSGNNLVEIVSSDELAEIIESRDVLFNQ